MSHDHYYSETPQSKVKLFQITYLIFKKQYIFKTSTGVFSYKKIDKGTDILLKNLKITNKQESKILDLGCGYGVIGIILADILPKSEVYMTEINKRAVWLCKKNIRLNKLNNAIIKRGNLFEPFHDLKFDLIITNPPLALGKSILYDIFTKSFNFLNQNGSFQCIIRTKQGAKSAFNKLKEVFGTDNVELLDISSGYRTFLAQKV